MRRVLPLQHHVRAADGVGLGLALLTVQVRPHLQAADRYFERHDQRFVFRKDLRRAIIFVKTEARIPHIALLPYQQPLVLIALFFHHHRYPRPRTRRPPGRARHAARHDRDAAAEPGQCSERGRQGFSGFGAFPGQFGMAVLS